MLRTCYNDINPHMRRISGTKLYDISFGTGQKRDLVVACGTGKGMAMGEKTDKGDGGP
jgi:hypothetical protein